MLQLTPLRGAICFSYGDVVTYPGQVVTSMFDLWGAPNVSYHMHYNYTGVLWNIQRRLQYLRNFNFDTKIDEVGQLGQA